MHVHPLPPNQEKSFAQKCPKEEIKFRPEISAKQNVYIPLRYDKTNTKVLEINKQANDPCFYICFHRLSYCKSYVFERVEPLRTFFKNHNIKAHANGPNMLHPFAWNHNNVGTCWHLLRIV